MRAPAPPPNLEAIFALQLRATGMPPHIQEYVFHPTRMWRFDFAWPDLKIAIEIEGGTGGAVRGRHVRPAGFMGDCIKYNEAALLGWIVLRGDSQMVKHGTLLAFAERAIKGGDDGHPAGVRLLDCRMDRQDGSGQGAAAAQAKGVAGKGEGPEKGGHAGLAKANGGKGAKDKEAEAESPRAAETVSPAAGSLRGRKCVKKG